MNNFTHKVYLLTEDDATYQALLNQADLPELEITDSRQEANILLTSPPMASPCISEFSSLEWIQSIYAGVDALVPSLENFSGELTNVKGIFGQQISEYVLGYLIQHCRHFNHYQAQQHNQSWQPKAYRSLNTLNLVILGTGSIGSYLAATAKAFGLHVAGVNRSGIPAKNSPFDTTYHIQELSTALKHADVIVNTLPDTSETQGIFNQETLSHCHKALLFNVGRGSAIDEQAIITALEKHWLEHAFLDVFEQEPLAPQHPFWSHPNITITPHIAAISFPEQVVEIFTDNYHRWRDGFGLLNQIDLDKGY
ncbi:phosphoglycerate dehydrogenase [Vibrio sinaloensis DSM 21326]|uniref:Phosphoglycerate dehydrogenase n=1 Tax=Vibrio sinaloensis DSM 21326 TaxID=945550 RepID=E8M9Y6_PHOS4|nr:D-2-hydroxyacid dehydrogenase [Vibrio sinaloensis]EGA69179.1 phosphoglycerate dehydrogenase [Vibrio sinaloensis DSM 21326]